MLHSLVRFPVFLVAILVAILLEILTDGDALLLFLAAVAVGLAASLWWGAATFFIAWYSSRIFTQAVARLR